jgi:tetratricopeptide (TPR) repeat protein
MSFKGKNAVSTERDRWPTSTNSFFLVLIAVFFLSLLLPCTVSAQGPSGASSGGTVAQIQRAYRLYNEGDYRRAAEILEGLKDRGIIEGAEAAAEFASRLDPEDYLVLVARGNLALYGEDYSNAERLFRRARSIFPARPEAKNGIAAALAGEALGMMREGEFASAADDHGGLGSLLLERGQREEALRHLRRAVDLDTEDPRPFIILGKLAAGTDARRREARSLLQEGRGKAVRLYGMYRAEALFRDRRKAEAERVWREIVERFPLHYEAHVGLGRTLAATEEFRAAAVSLRRALDVEPEKAAAYSELQSFYRRWGREEDLLFLLERRMLKDKYNPLLYSTAAETARRIGRLEKAEEYLLKAKKLIDGELYPSLSGKRNCYSKYSKASMMSG